MLSTIQQHAGCGGAKRAPARATGQLEAEYGFVCGEHELVLLAEPVDRRQVQAVRDGQAEFALVSEGPVILICSRFEEAIPWTVAPFCWHLTAPEERVTPPAPNAPNESRISLSVRLVEGRGPERTVRATRCVTLSLDFTRALNEAIRDQTRMPFDPNAQRRALERLARAYPRADLLLGRASIRSLGSP